MLNKKITCPFCFKKFTDDEVQFRCINPRCTREMDTVYATAHGKEEVPMGHVFSRGESPWYSKFFGSERDASCDLCSKKSSKRLCPHCHFELSHDAGQIDDHIIAIIGGRETGKGHYIATLIHRLEQEVGSQFNFALRMLGDDTRRRFENDYRGPLFREKRVLNPTQSAQTESSIKSPMVFRLTFKQGRQRRAVNLSFFDSAGEDMRSLDTLSAEARYICFADGIIFLLDPLKIDAVRQKLGLPSPNSSPSGEFPDHPVQIVERLRELFERQFALSGETQVKTPVAFVLSKVDTLFPIIDPGSDLRRTGEHFGYFNLTDAQSVHTEIWNYLQSWMGGGFSNRAKTDFANFHYFGVSSLGQAPSEDKKLETVSPIRVEDPFLWILYKLGFIQGRKEL